MPQISESPVPRQDPGDEPQFKESDHRWTAKTVGAAAIALVVNELAILLLLDLEIYRQMLINYRNVIRELFASSG